MAQRVWCNSAVRAERLSHERVPDSAPEVLVADGVALLGRERWHVRRVQIRLHPAEHIAESLGEFHVVGPGPSLLAMDPGIRCIKIHIRPAEVDGFGIPAARLR